MRMRIWAPRARSMDVVVAGEAWPLARLDDDDGFFEGEVGALVPGARYGLSLDGQPPIPDPRSRSQPDGVDGLSCVVDPAFPWTDTAFVPRPLEAGVVVEVHVGTFSAEGTFDGAIRHLDHLVDLGVTHVELLPVVEFPGAWGWGYDGASLYAPHHAYGGPQGLKRLVDACHARGLGVIVDVVYNHLGPTGNYLGRFGPYFTDRHKTPWGDALNFDDRGSEYVRTFFLDNARMWFEEFHADGLRLDAVHAIVDTSAVHFLEELSAGTEALGRALGKKLVLIAESDWNDPRVVRAREDHGLGMDAQWSDDFHHALHSALSGERDGYYADYAGLTDVARALMRGWVYEGQRSASRGRRHGRAFPRAELPASRLLGYAQTHDQVGNRAKGERLAALVGTDRAKVALALVLTAPFVPMLFAGEEWGALTPFQYFTNHQDEDLAESVRQGRRREFSGFAWDAVPDPQDVATFRRSKLDWQEPRRAPHDDVLRFARELIRLRRAWPALTDPRLDRVRCHVGESTLVVDRGAVGVVVNIGAERGVALPRRGRGLLCASTHGARVEGATVHMPRDSAVLVQFDVVELDPVGGDTLPQV